MAEEAAAAPPVEAPASDVAPAAAAEPIVAEQTNGDTSTVPKEDEETAGKQATSEVTAPDGATAEVAAPPSAGAAPDVVPQAPDNKPQKRKSSVAVPEHKSKKLNKKKSMPSLHLECKPGQFFWAKLKGYPPWPSVICDEQMLPESLLASRPVSTARPDGSIRDDFKEGGKNAKERTFPIMFLSTNEFTWMVNTSLEPLEPEQCKELPKTKMTKALQNAWKIASENHDLDYFKSILKTWQEEEASIEKEVREEEERLRKEAEERAIQEAADAEMAEAEELQAKKKAKSRKSKGGDDDVDMEDADAPKSSKKRKKDGDSDAEGKPKKTPKVTKLNAPKTPNGEASTKKSVTKSKKKVVQAPKEEEEVEKTQLTEEEKLAQREKAILYLRHRLQKGFLSRDQAPQAAEMESMSQFFTQLEDHTDLEPAIIRNTKVHKVLKGIVKLSSIPKDEQYDFKKRSAALLETWNKRMAADGDVAPPSAVEPKASATETAAEQKAEEGAPATNGEILGETANHSDETMEGAEKDVKARAEEAAQELDEKVEEVAADKTEPAAPADDAAPATAAEPAQAEEPKDVEMSGAMPDGAELKSPEPATAVQSTAEATTS